MIALFFAITLFTQTYDGLMAVTSGYTAEKCQQEKVHLLKRDDIVGCNGSECWSDPKDMEPGRLTYIQKATGIRLAECVP